MTATSAPRNSLGNDSAPAEDSVTTSSALVADVKTNASAHAADVETNAPAQEAAGESDTPTQAAGSTLGTSVPANPRQILLVANTGRDSNLSAAAEAAEFLSLNGIEVFVLASEMPDSVLAHPVLSQFPIFRPGQDSTEHIEMVLVLGGDGTFLRAADIAHQADLPVLGINLGHVGFLAEWEQDSLPEALMRVLDHSWRVEDRMTLSVTVHGPDGQLVGRGWALNEVAVENINRQGVLDAILEVDQRPVSSFGCDGVLISTPTGSTAYAFSAGGPVLWPSLDAILVVPNNAHALFARPLVVSPHSEVAVETNPKTNAGTANLDGIRQIPIPPGSRVEVHRGDQPVRWVRLDAAPFTDRLVSKFRLPISGWRGPRKPL